MQLKKTTIFLVLLGLVTAASTFWVSSFSQTNIVTEEFEGREAVAIFAGGCFWCIESDFDKVEGVLETISGYTGGTVDNPTYKQVSYTETGHYEAVKVVYDPARVTYGELVEYFWRHVDPTDAGGQFCDRGTSYRTAIFTGNEEEEAIAAQSKSSIEESEVLPGPIVTPIIEASTFWPAEDYHQNYYQRNPLRYSIYRNGCGRDARVREIWKKEKDNMAG
ncbi:MAG: peptide-methionine (S)-S-oxide reductase MsrA [Pseudomonadota bacterium]